MFDFIIVGQGIAGSVLAITLINNGYTVCVIDKPTKSLSSKVAAGIWNPVVFKRLTKSWLADDLVPQLQQFYFEFEKETNSKFLHQKKIIKPFTEEQEQALWLKKSNNENTFLENKIYNNLKISESDEIKNYSHVLQAGNIDVLEFLNQTKTYLQTKSSYLQEEFNYENVTVTNLNITYKNITAQNIVFCEGYLIKSNPFFNYIPMKPAKGEVLTIECEQLNLNNHILNKGVFIMPIKDNLYKVGATYEWNALNDEPTTEAKHELEEKLKAIISVPYKIIKHEAGVRPSTIDRRPVIGNHPLYKNCFIFNGFGTKAIMLAPYFANQFYNFVANKDVLNSEVNINRFNKLVL